MGKRKKIRQPKSNNKGGVTLLEREREESANRLLDLMLVDKDNLGGKEYDFTIVPNIYSLLYGFDVHKILENCRDSIDGVVELKNFRTTKLEQHFKYNKIDDFFLTIVGTAIPERYKGIDAFTKLKVMKMLLGYYLLKVPNTNGSDICLKAIYLGLGECFNKYMYLDKKTKSIDLENLLIEPLDKEFATLNSRVFMDKHKVNYLQDLVPYFNGYTEGYIDYQETDNPLNIQSAIEKVSEENRKVFEIIHNLGYLSLTEEEINNIAKDTLSEELYISFKESVVELNEIYYKAVIPLSYYIAQKELTSLISEERVDKEEALKKLQETVNALTTENKTIKRLSVKAEKELLELQEKLRNKEVEVSNLNNSKCNNTEYENLKAELDKLKEENQSLVQEATKWKNKSEGGQARIKVLEERVDDYNDLVNNLVELQQENILLQEAVDKVEDLENYGETEDGITYEEMLEVVKELKIFFVGGTANVGNRLQETLPYLEFIDISDRNLSFIIPETVDCVVLYSKVTTHAHTERVYSLIGSETPVIYVNVLNTKLVVEEIYSQIINGHK